MRSVLSKLYHVGTPAVETIETSDVAFGSFSEISPMTKDVPVRPQVQTLMSCRGRPKSANNRNRNASFYDVISERKQHRLDGQAKCLGDIEVNDQLEFRRLLDGQIRWSCTF